MKLITKLLTPLTTVLTIPICACSNMPKGMPNINIVKHDYISISYSTPKAKSDFVFIYKIESGYSLGDIRVWNKNSSLGEQEITSCIIHEPNKCSITIPSAKFWNYEYVKIDINVLKNIKKC